MVKLNKLRYELLPRHLYSLELAASDSYLFIDPKKGKGIEMLEKRWKQSIVLNGDYVDE